MRRLAIAAIAALTCLLAPTAAGAAKTKPFKLPKIKHVFVIVLENQSYESTFGDPTADPLLARAVNDLHDEMDLLRLRAEAYRELSTGETS